MVGLMRDMFTHKITTPEHWRMLMMPTKFTKAELDYDLVVGKGTVVEPSYDPHCTNGDVSGGCFPVAVLSAEKLRDYTDGPKETAKIGNLLKNNPKMSPFVIDEEAWDCVWTELIHKGKGLKTVMDRPGHSAKDYNFSAEILDEMIKELNRLINKYSTDEWNALEPANRVVELLTEHRTLYKIELDDINSGRRKLTVNDFLGPKERMKMRLARKANDDTKPNTENFDARARRRMEQKIRRAEQARKDRKAKRRGERVSERKLVEEDTRTRTLQ